MRFVLSLAVALAIAGGPLVGGADAKGARDQVVISGSVTVPPGQTAGDVVVIDGPVNVAGHVDGDIVSINGVVTIAGTVDGDVVAVRKRVHLLPEARISGDLSHGGPKPLIESGAVVSGKTSHENWSDIATGLEWLIRLILWAAVTVSTLIVGIVLLNFSPSSAESAWVVAQQRTGLAAGWAAGLFFGVPIVIVVAMATLVGLPLGLALLLALLPLMIVGYVTSCLLLGRAIFGKRGWSPLRWFVAGWGIARLVALVPFLGGLAW